MKKINILNIRTTTFIRHFNTTRPAYSDIVKDLYLSELKKYKPIKSTAKVDLPETFAIPAAPAAPAFDKTQVADAADVAVKEEAWPALVNEIDNPENFNSDWILTTDVDDGSFYPKRVKEPEYHD